MLSPTPRLLWMVFALAVPAMSLAGINAASTPWVSLFLAALVGRLTWDAVSLTKLMRLVEVKGMPAATAFKDRTSILSAAIQVPAGLKEVQLALNLPPSFSVEKAVGSAAVSSTVEFGFKAHGRGDFVINNVWLSAFSPGGLWRLRVQRPIEIPVQVFPDLTKDPAAKKLFATLQQGNRVQRVIGRGREVERLRDYAPGDSFDEVYWKATARRGSPISKVFQVERTQDIYAIVDGSRLGNRNEALERFVTSSLLLAIASEKNADNFGLLTFSNQVHQFVRASHGKGHFHRCRQAIFDLQPRPVSPDFGELLTFINLRIRKRALLFFLTDLSDPLLAETFSRHATLIARRHVVMVNQIADSGDRPLFTGPLPATDQDVQGRLAGHLQWARLRELARALSHMGVRMNLLKPDLASLELIAQYTTIKQRQLL